MKKTIALLLAVLMVVGLFAGCQKDDSTTPTETKATQAAEEGKETKPAETKKPAEIPTIQWYAVGNGPAPNQDSWDAKMNAYLEEKIGVHLKYNVVSWGDWGNRSNNMIATNDPWDIMFGDMGNYKKNINMNAYLDIAPYLDQVPGLRDAIPESVWQAATIHGGIYGVPTYKDVAAAQFWFIERNFADTYLPNYKDCTEMDDFTDALVAYKNDTGRLPIVTQGFNFIYPHYDSMGLGIDCYGVDMYAEGAPKIIETFRDDFAQKDYAQLEKWIDLGVMNSDGAVRKSVTEQEYVLGMGQGWPSAWISRGVPIYTQPFREPVLNNSTSLGSINSVSASSKYPLEALKVLELVNTDTWVRDSFCYGEEGVNWEYVEENGEKKVHRLNMDWGGANYTQGQFFIETPEEGTVGNPMVDEVLVQNEKAHVSPCIGFHADTREFDDKLDEMRGIFHEFGGLINSGAGGNEAIDEMYSRLDSVGAQDVVAELQRQLDEWWAEKNA